MAIYLIRHGETAFNRERVMQWPDTPLSERGLGQARRLARRIQGAGIARIVSSDMARAAMTAACVAEAAGLEVEHEPLLQERNFGALRGTPYSKLLEDPFAPGYEPPDGESWPVFHQRVERAWRRVAELAACSEGHLAIVSHGLVLHSIAACHIELPPSTPRPSPDGPLLRFGNTALSIVTGHGPWRAELFACTAHLDGAESDDRHGTL